jgi:hypothetical protein
MSSTDTAARFRASYEARERRLSSGNFGPRPWRFTLDDTNCLRETMLGHVGRFARTRKVIFDATVKDFGSCEPRRLDRALKWLFEAGRIKRVDGGYVKARRQ